LAHCFTCSRHTTILRDLGKNLARAGYLALRFDFSGNGQSEGSFEETTFVKSIMEILCAVDVLHGEGASWIGLAGHSMGAEVSLLAAADVPAIQGVCALAGRLSGLQPFRFLTQDQIETLHRDGRIAFTSRGRQLRLRETFFSDAGCHDIAAVTRTFDRPLLIVHGEKDAIVPVSEACASKSLNPGRIELQILPGADHMFTRPEDRLLASQAIVDWFNMQR